MRFPAKLTIIMIILPFMVTEWQRFLYNGRAQNAPIWALRLGRMLRGGTPKTDVVIAKITSLNLNLPI